MTVQRLIAGGEGPERLVSVGFALRAARRAARRGSAVGAREVGRPDCVPYRAETVGEEFSVCETVESAEFGRRIAAQGVLRGEQTT